MTDPDCAERFGMTPGMQRWLSGANRIRKRLVRTGWDLIEPIAERVGPIVEIEGIRVRVDPRLGDEVRTALHKGDFAQPEIQVVKAHLSPDDTVMELGAGIGVMSSFCAKCVGSERVFTYEANPAMERMIRHTYKLNRVSPLLEVCLVGERAGVGSLSVAENFWTSSTIWRPGTRVIKVPVKPFNLEIQRRDPTFLIVDIEGAEYELCRYADFHRVQKIVMEVHEDIIGRNSIGCIVSRLRNTGLTLHERSSYPTVLFFQRP